MPQTLSPFRYPGGKSQLYPFVSNLLKKNDIHGTYIETFAGGAGIGLKLLCKNEVDHLVINDFDASIFSVWNAILNHPDFLIEQINLVPFDYDVNGNPETNISFWHQQNDIYYAERHNPYSLAGAFATLFLNRTNRSGIITGGPLGGWSQQNYTRINARFNKVTLIQKIADINAKRDCITLSNEDALVEIPQIKSLYDPADTFIFFDPPYFDQGSNLYYSSLRDRDHSNLANEILSLQGFKWIVTYDHHPIIRNLYEQAYGRYEYRLNYSANKHQRAPEYLFSSRNTKIESFGKTNLTTI